MAVEARTGDDGRAAPPQGPVAEKLRRLGRIGAKVLVSSGALGGWDLDLLGFGVTKGGEPRRITDVTTALRRLRRLTGTAHLSTLFPFNETETIAATADLGTAFAHTGLDPDGAANWFAVGRYHQRAALLPLHRQSGAVAGLEPVPAHRPRPLHDDVVAFVGEFGLGPRQRELAFDAADSAHAEAAERWLAFLAACGL
ncbi:hypothetical protein [Phytomonospora endophytica]|uniref:Uncharacterized protein n=1 Tax=Phytomonospora endophytica TaxID=714109 RepID=A0A841F9I2_9ACTN|nr:hypothetical protein [Phytomonospora endophytica]MBB6032906.1 hypothetical protein [Phytomonospora endophytica]GIG65132.1 hypothetical protein Pen01_14270 [Phytomonospora endophytica]